MLKCLVFHINIHLLQITSREVLTEVITDSEVFQGKILNLVFRYELHFVLRLENI